MATEYYIRSQDSENSQGPYTVEKLVTLAEADQLDSETLFFNEETEQWATIGSDEQLKRKIFPEKKKLSLKPKAEEDMNLLNADEDEVAEIKVDELLAAAEGDTEETAHIKTQQIWQNRAAGISIPLLGTMMMISALTLIFPSLSNIQAAMSEGDYMILLQKPLIIVGIIDILFAIALFLSVVEIFPVLRLRAMLGLGYFAFYHWALWFNGDSDSLYLLICGICAALGVYICSITLNFIFMILFAIIGLGGLGGYAYFSIINKLF